ncbi:SDR family oxidoreductase [Deinococcus oregonensis]|uniref:SDR family oxidoreductase n=1 Tax=Deinococcus oregonensis TaxID=1805970 RepID=A0ABV6BAG5_9DEIO
MLNTIFITGTASGFGRATVERFARAGWAVAATVRHEKHRHIFDALPQVRVYVVDVTDHQRVHAAVKEVWSDFGHVDVVVNNAGFAHYGPLEASSPEQIRAQFDTNFFGLVTVCQAFLPFLRLQGSGTIVNVASLSAKMGFPFFTIYSASKAAVAALSEGLTVELAPFGIQVKGVFPGTHATQIFTKMDAGGGEAAHEYRPYLRHFIAAQSGISQVSSPNNVADLIWQAVHDRSGRYEYVAGRDATFLIALKRLLPQGLWKAVQVRGLVRAPSKGQLRLLSRIMAGTDELEVRADPEPG